jgi:hypothetical protein
VLVRRARVDDGCARDGSCVAARLVKHRDGARVVEFAFVLVADANQKKTLVDEFFGPEYSLVKVRARSRMLQCASTVARAATCRQAFLRVAGARHDRAAQSHYRVRDACLCARVLCDARRSCFSYITDRLQQILTKAKVDVTHSILHCVLKECLMCVCALCGVSSRSSSRA